MIKSIAIYIEGGGNTAQTLKPFRTGMSAFLTPIVNVVRKKRIRWRVIPCGGRTETYDAFVDAIENEPQIRKLVESAKRLEGVSRHASTHAAGVVIAPKPLTEYLPLHRGR